MAATIYDYEAASLSGEPVPLRDFQGQVVLVVNTASKCGFTPQYAGLEALFRKYREQGFTVLGFPCNQFGQQEPGDEGEIAAFCETNYGVSFPMFAKVKVNGPEAHPLFQHLKKSAPGVLGSEGIKWNFTKFLVDRQGRTIDRFGPQKAPEALADAVEAALAA